MNAIIVIPCYNESERLSVETFREFARANDWVEFVMVNDGSTDGTLRMLTGLADENPRQFSVLDQPENGGKATAVHDGMIEAIARGPSCVGFWDADLATPLEAIPSFRDVLRRRDDIQIVIGSRMPLLGHTIDRKPIRKLLGRLFAMVASRTLSLKIRDTQCGAKLFRVTPEMVAILREPFLANWIFDVEIFARVIAQRKATGRASVRGGTYEYPLEEWRDVAGSKLKSGDFVKAVFELASIYWTYLGPRRRRIAKESLAYAAVEIERRERNERSRVSVASNESMRVSKSRPLRKAA